MPSLQGMFWESIQNIPSFDEGYSYACLPIIFLMLQVHYQTLAGKQKFKRLDENDHMILPFFLTGISLNVP